MIILNYKLLSAQLRIIFFLSYFLRKKKFLDLKLFNQLSNKFLFLHILVLLSSIFLSNNNFYKKFPIQNKKYYMFLTIILKVITLYIIFKNGVDISINNFLFSLLYFTIYLYFKPNQYYGYDVYNFTIILILSILIYFNLN
jgi:hypothetical protein